MRKTNHGVINNVEFLALAIMNNPGQSGAFYRKMLLKSLNREKEYHRGYYCDYFRKDNWHIPHYGTTHWEDRSSPNTRNSEWYLTERQGLQAASRGHRKLEEAGLKFEDLL